jgi:hypothetical protein
VASLRVMMAAEMGGMARLPDWLRKPRSRN